MRPPTFSPLFLLGWDFRQTPAAMRERLSFSPGQAGEALTRLLAEGMLAEGVILSTCSRVEIYGIASASTGRQDPAQAVLAWVATLQGLPLAEVGPLAYRLYGADGARHLLQVAAGLESMVLGEDQILGQVREAFRLASAASATGTVLHRLFQKALETGKRRRRRPWSLWIENCRCSWAG